MRQMQAVCVTIHRMKQVLIYGDSLSWGLIPLTRQRLVFPQRWPGVFEAQMLAKGESLRVMENCVNGRRTVWSDPFKPGRDGSAGLDQAIEMNSPLSLVIMMLGTNDFQSSHSNSASLSAFGSARLIEMVRKAPIEPGMPVPEILLLAPPPVGVPKGEVAAKFSGAASRSIGLAEALRTMAAQQGVSFFDSGSVVRSSALDGIHLEQDQHQILGEAVADFVSDRIWTSSL